MQVFLTEFVFLMGGLVTAAAKVMVLVTVVCLIRAMAENHYRRKFMAECGMASLPRHVRIRRAGPHATHYFEMCWPREQEGKIYYFDNVLVVDDWEVRSKYPDDVLYVVDVLRRQDMPIDFCMEEKLRYDRKCAEREEPVDPGSYEYQQCYIRPDEWEDFVSKAVRDKHRKSPIGVVERCLLPAMVPWLVLGVICVVCIAICAACGMQGVGIWS